MSSDASPDAALERAILHELGDAPAEPVPSTVQAEVVVTRAPDPFAWRLTPVRDPSTNLIVYADLVPTGRVQI